MASRQEISVEELRLGMYVAELDRPWLDTKFPFQGFVIASQGSIERNPDAMLLLTKLRQKDAHHLERALDVSVLMVTFGRFLQLPREQLDLLGLVGLLKDIGKVKLPDTVLSKREPLTADEMKLARMHVVHSAAMLREAPGLPPGLADLVLLHHERFDGSGYPHGRAGDQIPLIGHMAAI